MADAASSPTRSDGVPITETEKAALAASDGPEDAVNGETMFTEEPEPSPSPSPSPSPLRSIWWHLSVLLRSGSKESVEYILQALWRTRNTGLDAADRSVLRSLLALPAESHLDPLLVCLRILIRRFVYDNTSKDEIHTLFPQDVAPELQRFLTLLLHKFQQEWRDDVNKEQQVSLPCLKEMTCSMENEDGESTDRNALIHLKFRDEKEPSKGETEVRFQLGKDAFETLLKSMYHIRDQMSGSCIQGTSAEWTSSG